MSASWGWDCWECGMSIQNCPDLAQLINVTDTHACPEAEAEPECEL